MAFVGSADDEGVGEPGTYHWFEHLPSRGTVKYPGGYADTEGRLARHGGEANAATGFALTEYHAHVPKRVWVPTFEVLTDMVVQPLLRDADIDAERTVILEELKGWLSEASGASQYHLPSILWAGHPIGHDPLGSRESLLAMEPATLRAAHEAGYTRSRLALFAAGDLDADELHDQVARCLDPLEQGAAIERRRPAAYGPLPRWKAGEVTTRNTPFETSMVYLLFPVPPLAETGCRFARWAMLEQLCAAGGLCSPLTRIVREDSRLAYYVDVHKTLTPDGGCWGLMAETGAENVEAVLEAFWKVLRHPELRSAERLAYVLDSIRGEVAMHDPNPGLYTETAGERLADHGEAWSDEGYVSALTALPHDELVGFLEALRPDQAHVVIFRGTGDGA
jgi:predicted Zn-dependent peptidase